MAGITPPELGLHYLGVSGTLRDDVSGVFSHNFPSFQSMDEASSEQKLPLTWELCAFRVGHPMSPDILC